MANSDDDWRREQYEWQREAELFGGGRGPRYFWTGSYRTGGSNATGGYGLDPWSRQGGTGSFDTAGGYGSSELYGGVGYGAEYPEYGPYGYGPDPSRAPYPDPEPGYRGEGGGQVRPYALGRVRAASAAAAPSRDTKARGPKGYRRSDERVHEDICERIVGSRGVDASDVTVVVRDGNVELTGSVPTRPMKHAIEDLVDACPGVQEIDNRIRVRRWPEDEGGASPPSGDPFGRAV
jgi:BON domain